MNRRLMMGQQNKGFELIYDAASGKLPTECGWTLYRGSSEYHKMENGWLRIQTSSDFQDYAPPTNTQCENAYFELEFYVTGDWQACTMHLNQKKLELSYFLSSYNNKVRVMQVWGADLYQQDSIKSNVIYIAKFEKIGKTFNCYLDNKLIYTTSSINSYLNDKPPYVGFNGGANVSYVKRMAYKEW